MKLQLLTLETSKEAWLSEVTSQYTKKIGRFLPFEVVRLKSKTSAREQRDRKVLTDSAQILDKIKESDFVILCDEHGALVDSQKLSQKIVSVLELAKPRILVIIGGPFGVSPELKKRANWTWSLSPLTLNHFMAQAVVLEQLYRSFAIWKGLPYHNE